MKRQRIGESSAFSYEDSERLVFARTLIDYRYDQRRNSEQSNDDFLERTFNGSFTIPARKVRGAAEDIVFTKLIAEKHKTAVELNQRWEDISTDFRGICLASQDRSVENEIMKKAYAGGKNDYEAFKAEIYAGINDKKNAFKAEVHVEIEKKKLAFGHFETMSICGWDTRDVMNPKPRLSSTSSMSFEERL
jgi:hypothetical protein